MALKNTHAARYQNSNQPNQKMRSLFLQRRQTGGQQTHENMFNITIRDVQIESTMRYQLTLVRIDGHSEIYRQQMLRGCGEKGTLLPCWRQCKLIQPLWRMVWRFLKKLKMELPYDPAIPLLGIHLEKTIMQKGTCIPISIVVLFITART